MLQNVTECYRVVKGVTECYRVLQSVTEYCRVLQSTTECYRVLQSISSASTWTNFWACLRSSNNGMQPFQLSMMSLHLLSLSTFGSFSFLVVCCLRVAASFVVFSLLAHLPAESTPSIASIKTNKAVIVIFILASVASIL